jgi:hypothetical protein
MFRRSLVLILRVFRICRVYRGPIFLLSTDSTYSCVPEDKGGPFFSDLSIFSVLILCTNWCTTICITCPILCKIEYNEFVCNKFVLVLVQIDLIQFENSNCIRSICTKFDTNLLHTNLLNFA